MAKKLRVRIHSDHNWSDDVAADMLISHLRLKAATQQVRFPKQIQVGGSHGSRKFYISCYRNALYDFCRANVDGVTIDQPYLTGVSTIRFELIDCDIVP